MTGINELIRVMSKKFSIDNVPKNPAAFISSDLKIFPISSDTKLLSKLIEITAIAHIKEQILPSLLNWEMSFPTVQNVYPDMIFENHKSNQIIAIDFKSTYLKRDGRLSGFTLGTFNGYFKNRSSRICCNIQKGKERKKLYYSDFDEHYLLCYIYERQVGAEINSNQFNSMEDLIEKLKSFSIPIAIKHIIFKPKWKVASTISGSGNTANIGSINTINQLLKNQSKFSSKQEFNEYWRYYFNHILALRRIRKVHKEFVPPYTNFSEYKEWVQNGRKGKERFQELFQLF